MRKDYLATSAIALAIYAITCAIIKLIQWISG
jgi:hypothetical protein